MARDIVRTLCVIVGMAVACSLVVETRLRLAAVDAAHRQAVAAPVAAYAPPPPVAAPAPPGRLRAVGRAALDLADAAIGVVR